MKSLSKNGAFLKGACLAAVVALAPQMAFAQTAGTFTVSDVVDAVDLQGTAEAAATALAGVIAGLIVIIFAFRLLRRAFGWTKKAV